MTQVLGRGYGAGSGSRVPIALITNSFGSLRFICSPARPRGRSFFWRDRSSMLAAMCSRVARDNGERPPSVMPLSFPPLGRDPVSFEHPPVVEVAIAIQFTEPAIDLDVLGEFRIRVRDEYPRREEIPAAPPMTEDFQVPPTPPSFSIRLGAPPQRHRFSSGDDALMIQAQSDRLGLNWRRTNANTAYPRYRELRDRFAAVLSDLLDAKALVGGELSPVNFVEVVYVNQLVHVAGPGRVHPDLGELLTPVAAGPLGEFLPQAEDGQIRLRYRIDTSDLPNAAGRLYVTAEPAFAPITGDPLFLMVLTSRLVTEDMTPHDYYRALDLGRRWIVQGFKDLTTPAMHAIWGLRDTQEEEDQ